MVREINREELLAKLELGEVRLLDAQGPGWYERGHLPGAIRGRIDDPDTTLAALGDDLDSKTVVYCSSASCTGSALAAGLLEGRGYRNVLRYTAGKQDWIDAGGAIETSTSITTNPPADKRVGGDGT